MAVANHTMHEMNAMTREASNLYRNAIWRAHPHTRPDHVRAAQEAPTNDDRPEKRKRDYIIIPRTEPFVLRTMEHGPKFVVAEIARYFGLTYHDLTASYRDRHIVRARQLAYLILRERELSYPRIGALLNRDHSSVIHGIAVMRDMIRREEKYAVAYDELSPLRKVGKYG